MAADVEPAAGQKASPSTQPLTSTLLKRAELALGTGKAGICPEERIFNSCEAVFVSIGEDRLAEEVVLASLAGGCFLFSIFPLTYIIFLSPSTHFAFFIRKAKSHLVQPKKCPKLPQEHWEGTWWEEHGPELDGFHRNWDVVSAPSCLSCSRFPCVILCALSSFTEYSSSPAVQVR